MSNQRWTAAALLEITERGWGLAVGCRCGQRTQLRHDELRKLAEEHAADPEWALYPRLRCSACGEPEPDVTVVQSDLFGARRR